MKYVFVTGGVSSGIGKGVTISSIGHIFGQCGLRVTAVKIDPYLNVDAGTISPDEHGEVFVLCDGGETDLDLGNYERFMDISLTRDHSITTGKIYQEVISRERSGDYLGQTVQVTPHVTNEVQAWIERVSRVPVDGTGQTPDVCLVEIGGTVGDIESSVFLEAVRQFRSSHARDTCIVHVTFVPMLGGSGEQKTKPTQHSVMSLRSAGLHPDVICCRGSLPVGDDIRQKVSATCDIPLENVISVHDAPSVYHVPGILMGQNVHNIVWSSLWGGVGVPVLPVPSTLSRTTLESFTKSPPTSSVSVAIVGKYANSSDPYVSVVSALQHAAMYVGSRVNVSVVDASLFEGGDPDSEMAWEALRRVDGVIVPGGFGSRGIEGKISVLRWAREQKVPVLGICLGFQCMVVEFCRNVMGWEGACSAEHVDEGGKKGATGVTAYPIIVPISVSHTDSGPGSATVVSGANMCTGMSTVIITQCRNGEQSLAHSLYDGVTFIRERHRHRYEVDSSKVTHIRNAGMDFVGVNGTGNRVEILELPREVHPFYMGTQYHPEFTSRPLRPSPPFVGLVMSCIGTKKSRLVSRYTRV